MNVMDYTEMPDPTRDPASYNEMKASMINLVLETKRQMYESDFNYLIQDLQSIDGYFTGPLETGFDIIQEDDSEEENDDTEEESSEEYVDEDVKEEE